jgi:hypothetical protein
VWDEREKVAWEGMERRSEGFVNFFDISLSFTNRSSFYLLNICNLVLLPSLVEFPHNP